MTSGAHPSESTVESIWGVPKGKEEGNVIAPPEEFETERLRLRRLRLTDAEAVYTEWARDPETTKYLIFRQHTSVAEAVAFARRCEAEWDERADFTWIIERKPEGRIIGCIAAHPADDKVAIGYVLTRAYWGKGLMTEAVRSLTSWLIDQPDVFRVWAVCDCENPGSARVLEKAGFELEGTLRRWIVHPNVSATPRDVLCYSVVS